jgi:uncharacterized protein YxjI
MGVSTQTRRACRHALSDAGEAVAIGDDFWIETDGGERAFKVDGKVLRVWETFLLRDPAGASSSRFRRRTSTSATR